MRLAEIEAIRRLRESMEEGDVGWYEREVDVHAVAEEALGHILELCSAIETMTPSELGVNRIGMIEGFIIIKREEPVK
jgi:hypothetical protein